MNALKDDTFWCKYPNLRQLFGDKTQFGHRQQLYSHLYRSFSIRKESIYDGNANQLNYMSHGGIFNVQYSCDGSLLIAATDNKSLLIFDAHNHKLEHHVMKAHGSSVNYVKFLDSRMFASCSDDCTVALWDLRNLSRKLTSLNGHRNWVKNIEYDHNQGLLVTSAYDGLIIVWDINKFAICDRPLKVTNLLRMRLTNDLTKMIVSTNDGYMLMIHDLNLLTLETDLRGFSSELYRLMQRNYNCGIDMGSWNNKLFTAKRNRIELISDFPTGNEYGHISSLEVHPHDWSVASRNTSRDELSEWTCIHDIQNSEKPFEFECLRPTNSNTNNGNNNSAQNNANINFEFGENNPVIIISQTPSSDPHTTFLKYAKDYLEIKNSRECKIYKNIERLRYSIPEPNENEGFIKEMSFSSDGRVLCSPYKFGFRILSFNSNCSEMSDCVKDEPQELCVLKTNLPHPDYVVTTKFSPFHCQIASGCLSGRVIFSQPIL